MKTVYEYFDVFPRIVRAGKETAITIKGRHDHSALDSKKTYHINIVPMEFPHTEKGREAQVWVKRKPRKGAITIKYRFREEQEFQIVLHEADGDSLKVIANFRLYSLQEDLFVRRPLKGEMHCHSNNSDGRESPAFMASKIRSLGMDYMALTDHRQHQPSLDLIKQFKGVPIDFKLFPGEEVHVVAPEVHVVNFGGRYGVTKLAENKRKFESELKKIEKNLTGFCCDYERRTYAGFLWAYQKIKEAGGLSIMAHPHWEWRSHYVMAENVLKRHLEDLPFDAYELTSSFAYETSDTNRLQIARYYEARAEGKDIPIVGVTDAHSSQRADRSHTVVFASNPTLKGIIKGIRDLYSVAVETFPDTPKRAHGPYRLVKYTQYLLREVFPQHDELCEEEGRAMLAFAAGDRAARKKLALMKGQTKALYDKIWDNT